MEKSGIGSLSPQQLRCLRLVAKGYGSGEIARDLGIAEGTVNGHLATAVARLGAPNRRRAAAMLAAMDAGSLPPEKIPGENLRVDPLPAITASPLPSSVRECDDGPVLAPVLPAIPAVARHEREIEHADLTRVLKTIALIILIAAILVFVISHYPALIGTANDIYNALPPANITTS